MDSGEVVRGAVEAFNRGDFDAVVEFLHPDIEVIRLGGLPTVTGRESAFGLMLSDAFESQGLAIDELRVEGNIVLVSGPFRARGAGSGIDLSRESHTVFWVDGAKIRRMATYFELDEAVAAAGFADTEPG